MLYIRGIKVKEPAKDGVQITDEPVWGENTARDVNTATMLGDIKAWKKTVQITWPPMTFSEANTILDALKVTGSNPFYHLEYNDSSAVNDREHLTDIVVYSGNLQRTVASIASAYQRQTGVTVTFIER